ncbi:helix-turn-helix domain-containing protein [Sphingosinicella rhizophila]|uniref:XRE family transcriptional regulator n=1 Tax=Sphingosinicella rhizophila TaxID=3050082 RepID=A0ABU3QAT2_9SPHN|nr:XRE family transcriptional regulator [Sphingosinicella sp. GR2756]MDT9600481.1 XRE family transcriptional regulator [Sphingosinicella sp. GR2756]
MATNAVKKSKPAAAHPSRRTAKAAAPVSPKRNLRCDAPTNLGKHVRHLRRERGWSLSTLGGKCGIAASTLSKVENGTLSLTYDRLLMVAQGFGLSLSEFLAIPSDASNNSSQGLARMSFARAGSGERVDTPGYESYYVCNNLRHKQMVPIRTYSRARTLEELGPLLRHEGEEFIVVVQGRIELHTEFYEPEILEAGEGVYLDSQQGHGYINAGEGEAVVFSINSQGPDKLLKPRTISNED